jgi:hypothetical protein
MEKPFSSNAPFKNSIPHSPLSTKRMKILWKTLQTLAQNHNRPLGLRYGRLMMINMLPFFERFQKLYGFIPYKYVS